MGLRGTRRDHFGAPGAPLDVRFGSPFWGSGVPLDAFRAQSLQNYPSVTLTRNLNSFGLELCPSDCSLATLALEFLAWDLWFWILGLGIFSLGSLTLGSLALGSMALGSLALGSLALESLALGSLAWDF